MNPTRELRVTALLAASLVAGCGSSGEPAPPDRLAPVDAPLAATEADRERYSGRLELPGGSIEAREVGPVPIEPRRGDRPGTALEVSFVSDGLRGAEGRLGLLPPRAAARQEVAFGEPGQPSDARARWIDIEIGGDGPQRFELPAPGDDWHADWAIVVLELRYGRRPLSVRAGARSEMLADGTRRPGARAVLATVPVHRRPTRLAAVHAAAAPELDGQLDDATWDHPGRTLVLSRLGEPASELNARLGGPTTVRFAWDDEALYVAAELPDPDLYAPHRERDDPLYRDEAFELFIAGDDSGDRYLEFQVSARGVHFDARFRSYRRGDEAWDGEWRSAVARDGELDDRGGDRGWTVELAFPWSQLCAETKLRCPPTPDSRLRVNAYRLEKLDRKAQVGLALSPMLTPDFHAWANAAELVLLAPGEDVRGFAP